MQAALTQASSAALSPSMLGLLEEARQRPLFPRNDAAAAIGLVDFDGILYLAAAARFVDEDTSELPVSDPGAVLLFAMALEEKVLPAVFEILGDIAFQRRPIAPTQDVHASLVLADGILLEMITWEPPIPSRSLILGVIPLVSIAFLSVAALTLVFATRARRLARQ